MADLIYSMLPNPRREMICINPEESVGRSIEVMSSFNIGALIVRQEGKLVGIITERDILHASLKEGFSLANTTVGSIAYRDVTILNVNDPVERAMEVVIKTKRRHVLIEEFGELIAVISIGDMLYHILENKSRVIEHLENYIHT